MDRWRPLIQRRTASKVTTSRYLRNQHQLPTSSTAARLNPPMTTPQPPNLPRITMVTAVRNGAHYIEDTIRSVISQGYPNLEYIVVDGVSTDSTLDIVRTYEKYIAWCVSQPDKGVYDALNTGFARSTGEIMGCLNASDQLHIKSLFV